ncbi:4'-phosphopantetheinyl transferase superfamily protein [Pontibacter sp. 172403-2]|uniref:4'-phosphopantetheinyl transferase family protein n=1 Tax=Pontibacter rufus TaxID=2791028 RepID=UPI0018AFEE45|nr:4'-phosphopantetheinyl transferase superfamily protein [Pontibacter sp. 172403-2]MBF9253380.1 4'-phosphopantetheinyl transferase superfamily protein [Pontibacter sp. 172403-2]
MPLLLTRQLNPHTILGIWQLTEPVAELQQLLPPYLDASQLTGQVHARRQREWLASRTLVYHLLKHFTDEPLLLRRNVHGKPYFEEKGYCVSITHSPHLAAVILSDKYEVGTDIELITPKALRVADKFLSEAEKESTKSDEKETCLYWSAKETLYKMYSRKKLIFKENLLIEPAMQPNTLLGRVQTDNFSKLYQISFEMVLNHVLTYSIDQN